MDRRAVALALLLLAAGIAADELAADYPERATVIVADENGTGLGTVDARVADSLRERYVGLSLTDSLGPDEGMLFVHAKAGNHTYVMRGMSFSIDVVFVGSDGRITAIHHARIGGGPFRGRGVWVLELPYNWTVRRGVEPGDRVRVAWEG